MTELPSAGVNGGGRGRRGRSRWLFTLAAAVLVTGILAAMFGVKTRYSCGEGWDVSETSRAAALAACSAGDAPPPEIHTDLELGMRALVLFAGFVLASLPLRWASAEG